MGHLGSSNHGFTGDYSGGGDCGGDGGGDGGFLIYNKHNSHVLESPYYIINDYKAVTT